jgi:hypothetical protein
MKKLVIAVSVVLMASIAAGHSDHVELEKATDLPGSATYGLDRAMETVSLALTFDRESKAEKRLAIAEERLSEARELAERNQTEKAEKALKSYAVQMEKVGKIQEQLPEEQRSRLSRHVNATSEKRNAVLDDVLQKVPENARQGIETALERGPGSSPEPPREPQDTESSGTSGYTATGKVIPANDR